MRRTLARSNSVIALWLIAGAAASLPARADLVGAGVTIAGYCCTAPIPADQFTNTLTGTVPVSFPVGSLQTTTTLAVIPSSFDVTANQIIQTSAVSEQAAGGSFNGVLYAFSGAPSITNVTVDPNTTASVVPTSLSFTRNSIAVNDAGLVSTDGAKQILDITTSAATPPTKPTADVQAYAAGALAFGLVGSAIGGCSIAPPCLALLLSAGGTLGDVGIIAGTTGALTSLLGFLATEPIDLNYTTVAPPIPIASPSLSPSAPSSLINFVASETDAESLNKCYDNGF
jgi:hypothetical protein